MTAKELSKTIEDRVDQLAKAAGFGKDNPHLPLLREQLLLEASALLEKKLTEDVACRLGDRVLANARKELRERRKALAADRGQASSISATTTDAQSPVNG